MQSKMNVKDLDLYYGDFKALHNINLDIRENEILSFIGPSGCGKSTLLKCLNRMNDLVVDEVKDDLKKSALSISGGQQQRLCIARAIAVNPEVILMDEPTSALDPISTGKIEDLAQELKEQYTIVMVTHNMQQASRISDKTAFFLHGVIVEYGNTIDIFTNPREEKTELYVTGRFG